MVVSACVGSDVKSPRSGAEHKRRRVDKTNYKVISMQHTWLQEVAINTFMRAILKKTISVSTLTRCHTCVGI